jgi:hypothetical protein
MDDTKELDAAFTQPHTLTSAVERSETLLANLYDSYKHARDGARRNRLDTLRAAKVAEEEALGRMTSQLAGVLHAISEQQAAALELRFEMASLAVSIDAEQAHIESLEGLVAAQGTNQPPTPATTPKSFPSTDSQ